MYAFQCPATRVFSQQFRAAKKNSGALRENSGTRLYSATACADRRIINILITKVILFSLAFCALFKFQAIKHQSTTKMPKSKYVLVVEGLSSVTRSSDIKKEMQRYGRVLDVERDIRERCALVQFQR